MFISSSEKRTYKKTTYEMTIQVKQGTAEKEQ